MSFCYRPQVSISNILMPSWKQRKKKGCNSKSLFLATITLHFFVGGKQSVPAFSQMTAFDVLRMAILATLCWEWLSR